MVFFGLWTAISYMTAGGDEEKVAAAKQRLIYLIIAIAIAISLLVIKTVLVDLVGGANPAIDVLD